MADPLSLSASIVGLVSLADTAFRYVHKYIRGVKGAEEEITKIAQELQSLAGILESTRVLAQSLEEEGDRYDPAIRVHHVYHCKKTLSKIHDKMKRAAEKLEKGKLRDMLVQHLKWPFSKIETQEILGELERHKTNMNLTIETDYMQKMQLLLSKQAKTDLVANETRQVIRELHTEILVDARKRQVLEFFLDTKTINPQSSLDTNIKLRQPMTGLWLTESPVFVQWLNTPSSSIWLSGIPGGGKTVLAGAATQEVLTRASSTLAIGAAFFFCDYKNEHTLKSTNIIGAIASQLARQKNEAFDLLQDYYTSLHPGDDLPKKADADDLRALVGKICDLFDQVLIVIDGIDECGDGMDKISEIISDLSNDSDTISLAIFSRYEASIRRHFEDDFKSIPISARSEDIEIYVRAELESLISRGRLRVMNAALKDEIQEALVDQAQGMFRWVACQLEYLCGFINDFERREALGHLPLTLHETYLRLIQRLSKFPVRTQSTIQMCFQFIAFCPEKLSMLQLREAISAPEVVGASLDKDHLISEDEIALMCGSLLKKSADGACFEFAHFSVREFLEHECLSQTPGLGNYRISRLTCYGLLAIQSLRYLQLSNFILDPLDLHNVWEHCGIISTRKKEGYSFHQLAATYSLLPTHADCRSIIDGLMKSLFHPSKTPCLILFAMSIFLRLQRCCATSGLLTRAGEVAKSQEFARLLLSQDFLPIHLAAALSLPKVCGYLISAGGDPTPKSPLGTPLELSIASLLRFIHDGFDSESLKTRPGHLRLPIKMILPSGAQRNSTVELLERSSEAKLDLNASLQSESTALLLPACIIALVHNDFRILQRLLSRGANLDGAIYPTIFRELVYEASEFVSKRSEPLLGFLQHLGSLLDSEPEWKLEIGRTIWSVAVDMGLPFAQDPFVTDSRITMSKDALMSKAFATIKARDLPGLRMCLADERLDLSEKHRPPWWRTSNGNAPNVTLLHCAVLENNLEATSHLAAAGCDTNIPASQCDFEALPIQDCASIDIFEELVKAGACVTAVEAHTGHNIWHMCASKPGRTTEFLDYVAKRYPLETAEALLTKSNSGHTPLQHGLLTRQTRMPRDGHVERIMKIISVCSDLVGFWSIHEPLFGAAAGYGSDMVLRRLIEVGARLDPLGPSQETPLHHVGVDASSAMVRCLKELYPRALDTRFEGQFPLQLYLERCCRHSHRIEDGVARNLSSIESLESIDGDGTTLWEHYWDSSHNHQHIWRRTHNPKQPIAIIFDWLLVNHSAMLAYETSTRKSGLNVIFSFFTTMRWTRRLAATTSSLSLAQAIDASRYWEQTKSNPSVLRFLQFAIRNRLYEHIDMLLDHGVSVSEVVDNYSPVQIACRSPLAISFCSSADGKEMLCKLLDRAGRAHLSDLAGDGFTILHRLASRGEPDMQLHWLIKRVLAKGVEINRKGRNGVTPIMHHIRMGSLSCAEYLLQMGADPRIRDDFGGDAATEAARLDVPSLLGKLLENSRTQGSFAEWGRKLDMELFMSDGRTLPDDGFNVVHLLCWAGHVECLEFYAHNDLIDEWEVTSSAGWTPMHLGAFNGFTRIIEFLNSKGCQVMPEAVDGATPLHLAVWQRQYDACKALIGLGAQDIPDFEGITPTMYASNANDVFLSQALSGIVSSETATPRALVPAMAIAIQSNEIAKCRTLHAMGCPLDVVSRGCSFLALALDKGHRDIAEWLLDNGTNTSARMCQDETHDGDDHDCCKCLHVIEVCLRQPKLNELLAKLIDHCIADGSGWPVIGNAGLSSAIQNGNTEGLSTLLKCVEERAGDISAATNIPMVEVLHTVVNQEESCAVPGHEGWRATALHCAVYHNNVEAVRILSESGAQIDKTDANGGSALWYCAQHETYTALHREGASLVHHFSLHILHALGWSIRLCEDMSPSSSDASLVEDSFPILPRFLHTVQGTRGSIDCTKISIGLDNLALLLRAGIDLNRELGSGRSLMHLAIVDRASSNFILNSNLDLEAAAPFPWHLEFWCPPPFLNTMFGHFRKKLAQEDFARLAHLQPDQGWSPLCHASVVDNMDMLRNCISLGADLDFEGTPHGSALIVASACGFIEPVRTLVRAGASLSYRGERGHRSVFTFCRSKVVRRWLLVDRFTEQRKLDMRPHWGDGQMVRPCAGTAVAGLKVVGLLVCGQCVTMRRA